MFLLSFKPSAFKKENVLKINLNLPKNFAAANNALFTALMKDPSLGQNLYESLSELDFPVLIIHGDADKTVPIKSTSEIAATLIPGAIYKVYDGAPHGLFVTDKERLTNDIASFVTTGTEDVNETYISGDVDILPSNEEALVTRD